MTYDKKNESLDQKKYSSLRNNVQPSQSGGINRTSRVSFNISVLNGEMESLQQDEPFGAGKTQKSSIMEKPPGRQLQGTISELTLGSSRAVRVAQSPEEDSAFEETRLGKFLSFIDPIVVGLIFLNSITIGIGTLDEIEQNDSAREAFEIVDSVFLYIFSVEVVLTSIHFLRLDRVQLDPVSKVPTMPTMSKREKRKRSKALPWLIFDIFVIGFSWLFREGSIVRAFRILRAVRLINKVQSLKNLTRALLYVMPKMGALLFITVVLLLVFGIMCTFLFKDLYAEGKTTYDYFGRVDLSLLTLFQMMSFDNWHDPAREVMETYVWSWTIMVLWVFISGFVITNLIVAIVCESLIHMDTIGVKALTGQPLPNDEYSINDRGTSPSSNPNDATISERLMQLETAVAQLLNEENAILEELGKLKQQQNKTNHSE